MMNAKMKILLLDCNLQYSNRTRNLFAGVLRHFAHLDIFGPGYVPRNVLRAGLQHFIEEKGPYDFLISTEHVIFSGLWGSKNKIPGGYENNYVRSFPSEEMLFVHDIFADMLKSASPKIVSLFESDYYNFSENQLEMLDKAGDYLIGFGSDFIKPISKLPLLENEAFVSRANDNWVKYINNKNERLVSLPGYVSESEFSWVPLANRKFSWAVPGANYWARKQAWEKLTAQGLRMNGNSFGLLFSILAKAKLRPLRRPLLQKMFNYLFQDTIESAHYAFTCGSGLGWPLRKFFEIPALGTVLVCLPCNGFEALGFKHKINAIACAPDEILDVHAFLEADPDRAQSIAGAGRQLVWDKHTTVARARQLAASLDAIQQGTFAGSCWEDGEFRIKRRGENDSRRA